MTIKRWHEHGLTVEALTGEALAPAIADVARLRIAVFRAFPYLYDGDLGYEREYLHLFSQARGAVIVVARDAGRVVGAATGAPLFEVEDEWSAPFVAAGQDVSQVFIVRNLCCCQHIADWGSGMRFLRHGRHMRVRWEWGRFVFAVLFALRIIPPDP